MPPRLAGDERAVSEIVGALLLVVIVSSAAFGFGLFLHSQAKATQAQKTADLDRQREKLEVQAIIPVASGANWRDLTFRVASLHLHESNVVGLRINGMAVREVVLDPGGTSTRVSFDPADPDFATLPLLARNQLTVLVKDVDTNGPFFGTSQPIATTAGVSVEFLTERLNAFQRAFQPPNPVILLNQAGAAATGYILDATRSVASEDTFIVAYEWSVDPGPGDPDQGGGGGPGGVWQYSGRLAHGTVICNTGECPSVPSSQAYVITLTVRDNFGMQGTAAYSVTL